MAAADVADAAVPLLYLPEAILALAPLRLEISSLAEREPNHMPIDVDCSRSPRLLVYRFSGAPPGRQAQADLRETLITEGHLTAETSALIDLRGLDDSGTDLEPTISLAAPAGGWPRRRAYVVVPWMHLPMLRLMQGREADTTVVMSAFLDEPSALAWLEGAGAK